MQGRRRQASNTLSLQLSLSLQLHLQVRRLAAATRALKRAAEELMAMNRGPNGARGTSARRAVINARAAPPSLQLHLLSLLSLSTAVTLTRTGVTLPSL